MSDSVLIVDDSLTVRMNLVEAFEAAGFRAVPCATAAEARAAFAVGNIAVAVLDVVLPDSDGVELLKEFRDLPGGRSIPFLMLSSEAEVKDRVRALQTGADEYVGKPYDPAYVVAKARELVRSRRDGGAGAAATVLVIDDSPTFREELRVGLQAAGHTVILAASGEEGLKAADDRRPSAVVVDGVLPGIDGATVIRSLRLDAALRGVPCVLLTASLDKGAELRALDAGADAFVRKEDGIDVVVARLGAVLRGVSGVPVAHTASLLGPKKILAVDDSMTYRETLAATLRGDGYEVVLARSGEEALELLAVEQVDCILLDLLMPGLGGHETCVRIKSAPVVRDIPLIMLTASEDRAAMLDGLGAGADDFIQKSSESEVLKARVRAQIRRKQFEDENRRIREELLRKEFEAVEARATRELAETRARLVEELERRNKELEAFSYSVSHDLRAPLRAIDGFSLALHEEYAAVLDDKGGDYLRRVRAGAQRMGELIDDLLQLSRVSRSEPRRESTDLSSIARTVLAALRQREPDRIVEVQIADGIVADADGRLMQIVIENLLGNAWKFTSRVPAARIEFDTRALPEGPAFAVHDNGAGFDMAYAGRMFSPFQRLHSEAEFPGTGIGLATVHRVIDRHDGRVWAEGKVGAGATFFFTLNGKKRGVS